MADPVIRLKRSAVAGKRPTLANVELGEVALNTYDGNLFTRQDTGGVGIGTTVTLLTPWQESYGAASISYDGDVSITGVITASDGRLIAGVGISSEGTYIGSGITAFNFVGASVTNITVPSAGFSTISIDFNGLTGIFAKTENKFSATEGQTSFPINYEIGYIDVFLNGVRLNSDNFTATDGSTVGLTTAASAGDAVDIIVYEPQSSATPKRVVTNATATAGQTVFTVPSYDTGSNSMDVFLNGIKLDSAEFTETDGTTVTLAVGAALNDELQFISYESDNNFWSLNGSTLHRTTLSNPVAIGTNTSAGDYLTVGQPGAAGTSLFVHGGARITGILTIGTGSITLNGQEGTISGLAGGSAFDSNGNLGIGTTNATAVSSFNSNRSTLRISHPSSLNGQLILGRNDQLSGGFLDYDDGGLTTFTIRNRYGSTNSGAIISLDSGTIDIKSGTNYTQTARFENGSSLLVGKTSSSITVQGAHISNGISNFVMSGERALDISRRTNDGALINFWNSSTSLVGSISVSGGTVSYNPFLGSHWGRLEDNSKPNILPGTILDTVNKLITWLGAVFYVNGEKKIITYYGDKVPGDTVNIEYENTEYEALVIEESDGEELNKHVCVKINDTPASKSVFGVFLGWDNSKAQIEDEEFIDSWNDMYCAAVGNYFIRVANGQTPKIGDLIESDGNGCGVVQDDDIIRSKTVAKITSTIPQMTYDDGSFLVTCVLCCG